MASKRKRARRMTAWRIYQRRIDRLVGDQWRRRIGHPMRACPGYFRAEGWNTDARWSSLRHGS
jgi:hypothetical protein